MWTRRHAAGLFLLAVPGLLAACGGDDDGATATSAASDTVVGADTTVVADSTVAGDSTVGSTGAESADAAFPVTIEHAHGETTIEERPERIVALGTTDQDPLLALGVVPVAVTNWRGSAVHAWNEAEFGDVTPAEINAPETEVDFEAIAAADPDLIVALWAGISAEDYELLSGIAPTIPQSGDYPDFGSPWDINTRIIGEAIGESEQAEALIAGVEGEIADVAASNPSLEGTSVVIMADFGDGNLYVTPPDDARYDLLEGLGMDTAPAALDGIDTLSFEEVDQLNDVDVVFWLTLPEATIADDTLYTAQAVHTEGRDIFPASDSELGLALTFGTALSIPYTLDQLVPMLTAAADRDPATPVTG